MINKANEVFNNFLAQLHTYDYYAFIWIGLVFFILLVLSVVMVKKRTSHAVITLLFAFIFLISAPFISFYLIHNFVYKTEVQVDMVKKLHYSKSLVIKGTLINRGIENFQTCKIEAGVIKTGQNFLKDFVSKIKPMKKKIIFVEKKIIPGEIHLFNFIIEPYTYRGDFNVTLKAECKK